MWDRGLQTQHVYTNLQRTTKSHRRGFNTTDSQHCSLPFPESTKSYLTTSDARDIAHFILLTVVRFGKIPQEKGPKYWRTWEKKREERWEERRKEGRGDGREESVREG